MDLEELVQISSGRLGFRTESSAFRSPREAMFLESVAQ